MNVENGLRVAVIGATGAVGQRLLSILQERQFPVRELIPFSSSRSEGKVLNWDGKEAICRTLESGCFENIQMAFFDASDAVSREWVPQAAEAGAWVIDNSATFRMESDIPLLVPEVNGSILEERFKAKTPEAFSPRERIFSGPNCVAAPLAVALKPLESRWGIKRVVLSTYQSTSGAGAAAMDELSGQTRQVLQQGAQQEVQQEVHQKIQKTPLERKIFPHQIAFNCIPHIGSFKSDGVTGEETKVIDETRKLLGRSDLRMSVTAVRVPTFACHGESVNVELRSPAEIAEVRAALRAQAGVIVQDDPARAYYPLGVTSNGDAVEGAAGRDAVYVGRIRKDPSVESGVNLWLVSDNLRKGAALNAVQVGEALLKFLR